MPSRKRNWLFWIVGLAVYYLTAPYLLMKILPLVDTDGFFALWFSVSDEFGVSYWQYCLRVSMPLTAPVLTHFALRHQRRLRRYRQEMAGPIKRRVEAMRALADSLGFWYQEGVRPDKRTDWYPIATDHDPVSNWLIGALGLPPPETGHPYRRQRRIPLLSRAIQHAQARESPEPYTMWQTTYGYPFNVIGGVYEGYRAYLFDYHEYSGENMVESGSPFTRKQRFIEKDPRDVTVVAIELHEPMPTLVVYPEGLWDAVVKQLGATDIDLESFEFSETYRVWADNKRYAYDVCNPRVMAFLMDWPDLSLKIDGTLMSIRYPELVPEDDLPGCLDMLLEILELIPERVKGS